MPRQGNLVVSSSATDTRGQFLRRIRMWSHWSGGATALLVAGVLCAGVGATVVVARSSSGDAKAGPTVPTTNPELAHRARLVAAVTFSPTPGSTGVPLDSSVAARTTRGRFTSVLAVSATGAAIPGTMTRARTAWRSNRPLLAGTTYRITATVVGEGTTARPSSTFRTLTPTGTVTDTIFPGAGLEVGVAQPVVVRFNQDIQNPLSRAAALAHFTIIESRPVPGGWHWFSNHEVHFRPQSFWPSGEKVIVASDLAGWNAGDGLWGDGTNLTQFTVGDARISIANLATDQMTVTQNGMTIATYPFSGGRTTDPTMNGMHIVMDRESVVRMISSTNGIPVNSPDGYDELVYDDVHISDSGEYVHAAPWSVSSQGHRNVSHGCINLSPADALRFFGFSHVGDVVWVVGGPRPPAFGDHGVMDWDTAWNEWTPGVVHSDAPRPVTKPRTARPAYRATAAVRPRPRP
jgi:lipoprotein-anchoring transpeptidase ErfK/SrfK